jgi:hypothetical protein
MLKDFTFSIINNEKDIIDFEKGIYRNFYLRNPDNWIAKNYTLIENNRLKPKVDYSNQIIIVGKEDNNIVAGISYNINNEYLEMHELGFKITDIAGDKKYCEVLLLYIDKKIKNNPFEIGIEMNKFLNPVLKEKGFQYIYGTCAESKKILYEKFGWEFVFEKKEITNKTDEKYLLRMKV